MTIMDFFYVSGWTLILIYKLFFLCVIQTTVAKNAVGKFLKSSSLAKKKSIKHYFGERRLVNKIILFSSL